MADPDPENLECNGQDESGCPTTSEADMGVSGGTPEVAEERDDSGEIRHGCKRRDYWRLLERAREGRTENQKGLQNPEIFESMLGE